MQPLRILTYNIHGGIGRDGRQDYKRIGRLLQNMQIDIAMLQEVETRPPSRSTDQDIADLCGDHFSYYIAAPAITGPHGWYGNAILSRHPFLQHTVHDITFRRREPRNIVDALIDTPMGNFRILNTHKGLSRKERSAQLERISELLHLESEYPVILGGDINEWHTSARIIQKLDALLTAQPVGPTFPTYGPLLHLDRIWCRPDYVITIAKVLKTAETAIYSDHFPVLAEISPPSAPAIRN